MRYAEGFVKIQMRNVTTVVSGPAQTDLGVHVRAVQIDLATSLVHHLTNVADSLLEDTIRRGISYHET